MLAGCAPQPAPESLRTDLGPVRDFTLRDSQDHLFRPSQLEGKVWVAHFFFTTCTAGCSKTTQTMSHLHERFAGRPELSLVSISVNPDNDSAEVLQQFGKELKADPAQWLFLRGPEKEVHRIVQEVFFQAALRNDTPAPGQEFIHSFNLVLVDHHGNMAGFVDGLEESTWLALDERIGELLRQRQSDVDPARVWFPRLNAGLNGVCGILLVAGYLAIRRRREVLHQNLMLAALGVSAVFLGCYLYYHIAILEGRPTLFRGEGIVRTVYLTILLSHTVLAAVVAPLALYVAWTGWQDRRVKHVRLARWVLPAWLYVSVTGVVVYWMLYQLYPAY